jgi:glycosyltransferase involved in cell wall biosynthesis
MTLPLPIFLSVVIPVRNQADRLQTLVEETAQILNQSVSDYEIVVVDNGSTDDSVIRLKTLTKADGVPNLQVYALTNEVDSGTASWVGLENALGDFIAVLDPTTDDVSFLPEMLDKAVSGADVVFAKNKHKSRQSFLYRQAYSLFNCLYAKISGVNLGKEAPPYRVLSKRVVNFILQHRQPALAYRHLPATAGFARYNLTYSARPKIVHRKRLGDSIDRGMQLLVSTTRAPMRLVTSLSLFGAVANLVYSVYVVAIALLKADVEPGWVSLSLQQSGMFFLLSLVLLVLGEYILHMASLSSEGPLYHVGQEFTSACMTRREKLNIEEAVTMPSQDSGALPE